MAQEYIISNAYPAKDKDGNEKLWESQYGTFRVWNLYFEGSDVKHETNKKLDFEGFEKGDTVYGTVTESKYGNKFKSEQRPLGNLPTPPRASQPIPEGTSDLEAKIDYLTTLVEQLVEQRQDVILEDIEDKPIDLSEIPF